MHRFDYLSSEWRRFRLRVLARDGRRCTVGRLLGGACHPVLHVHHVVPVNEGGAPYDVDNCLTVCASHHPQLEAIRRAVLRRRAVELPPCRHNHRYDHARRECRERRMRQAA